MIVATTRAALIRGTTTTDDLGDEVESDAVVEGFGDFPVSIIERGRREFDPASGTWRTVRELVGRAPSNLPADDGDRLKDLRDGTIYNVTHVERMARGLSGRASVTLTLKR